MRRTVCAGRERPAACGAAFPAVRRSLWTCGLKRATDLLLAAVGLLLAAPVAAVCWWAVRREDGGPALFQQERVGRYGRTFVLLKFRTMRPDAEPDGPRLCAGAADERLTRAGRWLRRHHLDELPQLWNVLRGDMALVGPRPERPYFVRRILARDARYAWLYALRPGLTSYATLHNGYADSMEKMLRRLELDVDYLRRCSWRTDAGLL